jgi:hypothetical protein
LLGTDVHFIVREEAGRKVGLFCFGGVMAEVLPRRALRKMLGRKRSRILQRCSADGDVQIFCLPPRISSSKRNWLEQASRGDIVIVNDIETPCGPLFGQHHRSAERRDQDATQLPKKKRDRSHPWFYSSGRVACSGIGRHAIADLYHSPVVTIFERPRPVWSVY